jgi:hypothetical protein
MVHVTDIIVALAIFSILLVVSILLLGGIIPGIEQAINITRP